MSLTIAPLSRADPRAIETLLDAAFGHDRHSRTAYRIRAGMAAIDRLSFAAFADEALVGTLQSWPVAVGTAAITLVGPVAVHPNMQRAGIGRTLMTALVDAAADEPMVMIGDPEYYGRFFGFSARDTGGWNAPGPVERHRLLAKNSGNLRRSGVLGPRAFALAEPKA